ncbi:MAG: DUF3305 domain-containing protein [Pseudolabrys sp.]
MSVAPPLATIPVGVVVERTKAASQWVDFLWRPVSVLTGIPETAPWSKLSDDGEHARFYAGAADIELYRTETANYRSNLTSGEPMLWVVLRPTGAEPPYALFKVTADPAEGEAMTEAGNDLVETVPMPAAVQETVAQFVAEHHVEQVFFKRKRDRASPDALSRRRHGEDQG